MPRSGFSRRCITPGASSAPACSIRISSRWRALSACSAQRIELEDEVADAVAERPRRRRTLFHRSQGEPRRDTAGAALGLARASESFSGSHSAAKQPAQYFHAFLHRIGRRLRPIRLRRRLHRQFLYPGLLGVFGLRRVHQVQRAQTRKRRTTNHPAPAGIRRGAGYLPKIGTVFDLNQIAAPDLVSNEFTLLLISSHPSGQKGSFGHSDFYFRVPVFLFRYGCAAPGRSGWRLDFHQHRRLLPALR